MLKGTQCSWTLTQANSIQRTLQEVTRPKFFGIIYRYNKSNWIQTQNCKYKNQSSSTIVKTKFFRLKDENIEKEAEDGPFKKSSLMTGKSTWGHLKN